MEKTQCHKCSIDGLKPAYNYYTGLKNIVMVRSKLKFQAKCSGELRKANHLSLATRDTVYHWQL